jgi:hypothetical protein
LSSFFSVAQLPWLLSDADGNKQTNKKLAKSKLVSTVRLQQALRKKNYTGKVKI